MLNAVIRFSLNNRLMIVVAALGVLVYGGLTARQLPIDVLPDLTRPRVVLITESPGLAPEEVETLVTFPLETSLNGAPGVEAVRSSSDIGLSVIYVEFGWGTDIYRARQIVQERIAVVSEQMPAGVNPQMAPTSSLLGQIMIIGMWSETGETSPLDLRTQADWVVRQRLLTIQGVSQVITMGGGRKQFQVLVDPHKLHQYGVSLHEVEEALRDGNLNVTGGYLEKGQQELLVRGLGRVKSREDIREIVVKHSGRRSVTVGELAEVVEAAQVKRGDSTVNGRPAVVLTIQKQPGTDTRALTDEIAAAVEDLRDSLPDDVVIDAGLYQQRQFIDYSVHNVIEALRDGAILVVIVLFLFLLNFRTTFITLTAIPLSVLVTAVVFQYFGLSINVMTLGGLAVAIGELVDDAIVDVESIFRRLKENSQREKPRAVLSVIYSASREVRGAIIISTVLVVLVFIPLFFLTGMEGRLFTPLAVAYIVSILASTTVSLTVTPVLSYYLLPNAPATNRDTDGPVLGGLKWLLTPLIRASMTRTGLAAILLITLVSVSFSGLIVSLMGKDFLPPFDEGAAQVNVYLPPGTSLQTTREVSGIVDGRFQALLKTEDNPDGPLLDYVARMGRAELDEHVMGVNVTEYILSLNPDSGLTRQELIERIHEELAEVPGINSEVEQPIAHLISHMLSGVTAQIAIKLYGDDLSVLRQQAQRIKEAIEDIDGLAEPIVEQQQLIPQLQITLKRERLKFYGVSARFVNEFIETAMNGRVVSTMLDGQRTFDIMVRLDDENRTNYALLERLPLELPDGTEIPLSAVAELREAAGPNTIQRENARRRIVVRVNTLGRDLGSAVAAIQQRIDERVDLPEGYLIVMGGQFEAQQEATERILIFGALSILGVCVVLYLTFPSIRVVLQILLALPAAFVGGVAALVLTGQTMSVAAMVGFISLGGIAARNGILLVEHYVYLYREQGFTKDMLLQGSLERLAPVLMTALTTGIGLLPLVIGGQLPGKEVLFPVATVILGGLMTSTLAEFCLRPGLFWATSRSQMDRLLPKEETADIEDLSAAPTAAINT